jgi:hypothetical protein
MALVGAEIAATARALAGAPDLAEIGAVLGDAAVALARATTWIAGAPEADRLASATGYLKLAGDVIGGWVLGRQALLAAAGNDPWLRSKGALARIYARHALAAAPGRAATLQDGARDLEAIGASELQP